MSFSYTGSKAIDVKTISDGIEMTCAVGKKFQPDNTSVKTLTYKDENSGEYTCVNVDETDFTKIYVKFRSKLTFLSTYLHLTVL